MSTSFPKKLSRIECSSISRVVGSSSKDDGNSNDDARKQCDWLNKEK